MPYDEDLAVRIREIVGSEPDLTEKKMFGEDLDKTPDPQVVALLVRGLVTRGDRFGNAQSRQDGPILPLPSQRTGAATSTFTVTTTPASAPPTATRVGLPTMAEPLAVADPLLTIDSAWRGHTYD